MTANPEGRKSGARGSDVRLVLYWGARVTVCQRVPLPYTGKKVIKGRHWSEGSRMRRGPAPDCVFKRPLPLCPKQRQGAAASQLPRVYLGGHPLAGH